jgi:hypothetical protein
MLLQTQVSGTLDALEICAWLLGIIVILIGVIWRSNESKSAERHQDILKLITGIADRQDELEQIQRAQQNEILSQKFELIALRGLVNLIQGKPVNFHHDEKN